MRSRNILLAIALVALPLTAQTVSVPRNHVRAVGTASVAARPDMARVSMGVTTEGQTASEAAARNADQAAAVMNALRNALGPNAEIHTISYTLGPVYNYPPGGGQPQLRGFQASNIVEAIITDLSIIGRVIDAAITAGANRVDSLRLGLKDDDPVRAQALRLAGQRARAKAQAIAEGVQVRLGSVISAEENSVVTYPVTAGIDRAGAAAATTPVETGTLSITATVTLELEAL
jgi:uncharacterized protein YggE